MLVNNAGIAAPAAPVESMDPEAWEAFLNVNLTGTFNVTRLVISHLKKSGDGVILNMTSLGGRFGFPNRSPYATTKWGLVGFTKTLTRELGEAGIRVNAILPGEVDGSRLQRVFEDRAKASGRPIDEVAKEALANQSIKRFVAPREIARSPCSWPLRRYAFHLRPDTTHRRRFAVGGIGGCRKATRTTARQ